jgi:hypothetical protein
MKLRKVSFLFANVSLGRFQPSMRDDEAGQVLEQERTRNQMIEQIINRFRGQDELGGVLQALVDW